MPGTSLLPPGGTLSTLQWDGRHRVALVLLAGHLPVLLVLGTLRGLSPRHVLPEIVGLGVLLALGTSRWPSRRVRAGATSVGLVGTSAVLVHLTAGATETHIHFLLVIAVVAFYEERVVLGLAVAVSLIHHVGLSLLAPEALFGTPAAQRESWGYAAVHVGAVTAQCLLALRHWRVHERALAVSETILRGALDVGGDAYVAAAPGGEVIGWNQAAASLFGWSAQEVRGRRVVDVLLDDAGRATFLPLRDLFLATGAGEWGSSHQLRCVARDGSAVEVEATFWRVPVGDGTWTLHALLRDCGDRLRQQAALAAAQDTMNRTQQAKATFLANASHELRTPLHGVLGLVELLLDDELSPRQRDRAELLRRSGQGLGALLEDVLELTRAQADRLEVAAVPFDLGTLLDEVCVGAAASAGTRGLTFERAVRPGTPLSVVGDSGRLHRVLTHLLANAVAFTPSGGLRLVVGPGDGVVCFAVHDSGVGILPSERERLFEPFGQHDASSSRPRGGAGLGLAVARVLVEALGGRLRLDSVPGVGTVASFAVPLGAWAGPPPDAPASSCDRQTVGVPTPRRPLRLLLAEDSPVNQVVAVGLLEALGCAVDVVDDGRQALDRLEMDDAYDALLLDCQMPVLDGYDAVREVRAREQQHAARRLPVVALTASALEADRARCLAAGMDDYFSKPFAPDEVLAVLHRLVRT